MSNSEQDDNILVGKSGAKPEYPLTSARQSPWAGHRRHRHRQNRHAAGAGGRICRAPASRCSPPTSRAICPALRLRARRRRPSSSAPRTWASIISPMNSPAVFWDLFGEQGHPIRATVSEMGPLLLAAPARSQRHAGRRAQHRLPRRRRSGAGAARSQGPARHAGFVSENAAELRDPVRQRLRGDASAPSSASSGARKAGRPPSSSASPRCRSRTSCAPTATAAASSTSSPPTS